jgi:glycosyltransferase involved in cell wall biosynthesis
MRIGIDARTLSGRFTGDRTYWRGLIGGLAAIDTDNEYVLYTRLPVDGEPPVTGPNFTWRTVPRPANDARWLLTAFPRALAADRVDVAHTQYNIPLLGAPCPVITTVHDVTFELFPDLFLPKDRWILRNLVPRSMRRAARVITVSESTRRDILRVYKNKIAPENVTAVLLATDPRFRPPEGGQESARQTANERYDLGDKPYILSVGVLQPRKNLIMLLDAFALVKLGPTAPPHKLVIVGKRGWKNEALDAYLAELPANVADDLVWTGYVPDDDLPILYGGADLFCYPSLYEGFGLPPLEAMACGCPVISSWAGSLAEVVGDAGVQVGPQDEGAWVKAMERLLTQPNARERWRERGLERAATFSWERTARETLKIYEECRKQK